MMNCGILILMLAAGEQLCLFTCGLDANPSRDSSVGKQSQPTGLFCHSCHEPLKSSRAWAKWCDSRCMEKVRGKKRWANPTFREKSIADYKKWQKKNMKSIRNRMVIWEANNRDRLNLLHRNWTAKNRERARLIDQRVKAKRQAAFNDGTITLKAWLSVLDKFDNKCVYCGSDKNITMDHVMPLVRGGEHSIKNVVPACKPCNSKKNDRLPDVWAAHCGDKKLVSKYFK